MESLLGEHCDIVPNGDPDGQTLLVEYPVLFPDRDDSYFNPPVKLEAGARSALTPNTTATVEPYMASVLADGWNFEVQNINTIQPERTFLDKVILLHGTNCGFRDDEDRRPKDGDRTSRHYYDVAMMTETATGKAALADRKMLDCVRAHAQVAFRQAWRKLEEAVPGTILVVPPDKLVPILEADYHAMQGMMFGDAPDFAWVLERLQAAEEAIN